MNPWAVLGAFLLLGLWLSIFGVAWPASDLDWMIVQELRAPRALAAALVGSLLAVCGLLMQAQLRNPLAEPYILGLSGGASVAVLAGGLLGYTGVERSVWAFLGALASLILLFALTRAGRADPIRILLTGVLISAAAGALGSLLITLSDPLSTQLSLVWLMGDFSGAGVPLYSIPIWLLVLAGLIRFGRLLDLMTRGGEAVATLGLDTRRWQMILLGLVSVLTAIAVAIAGPIGFVGLVVPHLVRFADPMAGHGRWIGLCAVGGGGLLLWADWLGRVVIAPAQLPAGVIMALVGIPALLALLGRTYAAR